MAKFRITGPDGNAYDITAPDDATEDQVLAYAQSNYQPATESAPDFSNVTGGSQTVRDDSLNPTAGMSGMDKFRAGMGKAFVDLGTGTQQLAVDFANAPATMTRRFLPDATSPLDGTQQRLQQEATDRRQLDEPLMDTGAGLAGNIAGYGASLLLPGAALRGTAGARVLLPTTIAGNAAQGAVLGAAQPLEADDSRLANAGLGAALGAGGTVVARGIGALGNRAQSAVAPHVRELYQAAKDRGISLSPSQISDSRFMKWATSMLRSVPFTGAQGRYDAQVGQFNRELAKTIGEDADVVTSQVYGRAKDRQSQQFADLTSRNALQVDDQLVRSLSNIADSSRMAGENVNQQVESAVDALYAQATTGPNGVVIPGEAYQAFDAQLNAILKNRGPESSFLGNVQSAVRRAMDNSISPEDSQAWRQLRTEYGNRKTLEPLVAKAADGPLSPAQLMGAVTNSKSGKGRMAEGRRGDLGELAKIGQRMKEPPSSGTAERGLVAGMLGGGTMLDPVTGGLTAGALNLVSRGLDSNLLARYLMRENPGLTLEGAEIIIRRATNPAAQTQEAPPLEIDIVGGARQSAPQRQRLGQ